MSGKAQAHDDFFSAGNQANASGNPYFATNKIGDACRGFLVRIGKRKNDMKQPKPGEEATDYMQRVYTIVVPEGESYEATSKGERVTVKGGELIDIYGKVPVLQPDGTKLAVILGFDGVQIGQMIGVKYTGDKPAKQKGFHPTKVVDGFIGREFSQEAVEKAGFGSMIPAKAVATPAAKKEDAPF